MPLNYRQERASVTPTRISEPTKVSLVMQHGRPSRLRIEASKQVLALVDAYVDPFKSFEGFGDLPLTPLAIQRLYDTLGVDVVLDVNVTRWLNGEITLRRIMQKEIILDGTTPHELHPPRKSDKLYPFQRQGSNFMRWTEAISSNREGMKILQCDDPRLGKTIQTCVSVLDSENAPALVVCLKSLIGYWVMQLKEWTELDVRVLKGSVAERLDQLAYFVEQPNIVMITNWETLRKIHLVHKKKLDKIVTVIGDEAHIARNPKTQIAKGLHKLKPKNAVLLTATPLERGPQEYFSYLKFLRPWEFSSYWRFVGWFCEVEHNGFGNDVVGTRNVDLLKDLLFPLMLRRKASEVALVPPKIFEQIPVETSLLFNDVYADIRNDIIVEVCNDDNELIDLPNALTRLTRLRQLSADPGLLGYNIESPKYLPLLEIIEERYSSEKIVVFCSFNGVLDSLETVLGEKAIRFTGNQEEIELFHSDTQKQVFLTTPQKGGAGVDLSVASVIIYYDLPLSSTLLRQSMDRTTKMGIKQPRMIISLIASPIDQTVADLLEMKLETISEADIVTKVIAAEMEVRNEV